MILQNFVKELLKIRRHQSAGNDLNVGVNVLSVKYSVTALIELNRRIVVARLTL